MARKAILKQPREWNTRTVSQKWDGALQKWIDFMMPSGKCFVFPIQCAKRNLKLTNQLWNASASSHMDVNIGANVISPWQDICVTSLAARCAILGWISTEHISLTLENFRIERPWWLTLFRNSRFPNRIEGGNTFSRPKEEIFFPSFPHPSFPLFPSWFPPFSFPFFLSFSSYFWHFKGCLWWVMPCSIIWQNYNRTLSPC